MSDRRETVSATGSRGQESNGLLERDKKTRDSTCCYRASRGSLI
jgi:hypothetical protein